MYYLNFISGYAALSQIVPILDFITNHSFDYKLINQAAFYSQLEIFERYANNLKLVCRSNYTTRKI